MKSWDLHVCDRASTITHVDRVKKSNPWYNKIWLCLNVTIWSSQICFSVIFIHFVMIQNIWEKKLHLFTLFSITRHCFSLFLVGSKSMLALLPFKVTITPRHWNDKCFHRAGGDLICRFCICASHFQCIVGAQQEILCLTVRTTRLIWRVWPAGDHGVSECQSLYDSDTVKSSKLKIVAITKRDTSFHFKHLIANCGRKHACIYLQYEPRSGFNITDDIIGPETNISLLVTGDLDRETLTFSAPGRQPDHNLNTDCDVHKTHNDTPDNEMKWCEHRMNICT